ncbi:hypothetical protein HMPREF9120_01893 [Neisseria sp. oral taxon 020 str. F0370]|nr:hypothetical protein HMPREF9120_01893 [Neisseria sp. oral taxon 020 str. F0370]
MRPSEHAFRFSDGLGGVIRMGRVRRGATQPTGFLRPSERNGFGFQTASGA